MSAPASPRDLARARTLLARLYLAIRQTLEPSFAVASCCTESEKHEHMAEIGGALALASGGPADRAAPVSFVVTVPAYGPDQYAENGGKVDTACLFSASRVYSNYELEIAALALLARLLRFPDADRDAILSAMRLIADSDIDAGEERPQ